MKCGYFGPQYDDKRHQGWASDVRHSYDAELRGHLHQVGKRPGFHLLHHLSAVRFHRYLADAKLSTHLFVQQAGDHQSTKVSPIPSYNCFGSALSGVIALSHPI